MYAQSKYVIGIPQYGYGSLPQAIIIPETMAHTDVANIFVEGSITSAGFCSYGEDAVSVYGKSVSLKKESKPEDAILVGRAMAHPNYVI